MASEIEPISDEERKRVHEEQAMSREPRYRRHPQAIARNALLFKYESALTAALSRAERAEKALEPFEKVRAYYSELILQVSEKHPNETRHETALRYLREREERKDNEAKCEPTAARAAQGE